MKLLIHRALMCLLVLSALGCDRSALPNKPVSANADQTTNTAPTKEAQPQNFTDRQATSQQQRNVTAKSESSSKPLGQASRAVTQPSPRQAMTVPAGTALTISLLDRVGTDVSQDGEAFTGTLTEPLVVNGAVVAEKGAKVRGEVQNVEQPGKVKGRAHLQLVLTEITPGNRTYRLNSEPFTVVADDNKGRDAGMIAGGAGVGAAIGAIAGGKKGAALGAILGSGAGTTAVLMTKGDHVKLEPETRLNFVIADDLALPILRRLTT